MAAKLTITIPEWLDRICAWPVTVFRKHKYGYAYRRIYLGENKFTIVEPQDFYWVNNFHWCLKENGQNSYAMRLIAESGNKTKILSLHREIMNRPAGRLVDHRNGNGLDNRRENLRIATHAQNSQNKRKSKSKTSSRFIGASFDKRTGRWAARIYYRGKNIYLGEFDTEEAAARAYDAAAKVHFGEFACLNFPE